MREIWIVLKTDSHNRSVRKEYDHSIIIGLHDCQINIQYFSCCFSLNAGAKKDESEVVARVEAMSDG